MINKYESRFVRYSEAFASNKILRAIELTNKVVGKRAGGKIYTSSYVEEFANAEGKFGGIIGLMTGGRMIRYNYRLNDASAEIVSVDFWLKPKKGIKPPDYTFETEGINIVNLIDVIVSILKKEGSFEFDIIQEKITQKYVKTLLNEDFVVKQGKRSKEIIELIKGWAVDKDVTDDKLKNTRVSALWKDFDYWYKEIYTGNLAQVSEPGFKNYIVDFMKSRGIHNIYMRSIKVKSGNKEKIINTDSSSETAYKDVSHLKMTLDDTRSFMENSIRGITRGYMNSLLISGMAGFGKTTAVNKILKEEGVKVVVVNTIKNLAHLYGLFHDNNSPKTVILFDDCQEVMAKKYIGLVSAALDDHDPRIINFPLEVGKSIRKFNPNLEYVGKIIILTNTPKAKLPGFLTSRTVPIEVTATTQQIIDDIRKNLEGVMPEVSIEGKLKVLNFIEDLGKNIKSIDFRRFKRCMIFYLTGSPDWKKHINALLST